MTTNTVCPHCGKALPVTGTAAAAKKSTGQPSPPAGNDNPMNMVITIAIILAIGWAVYEFLLKLD